MNEELLKAIRALLQATQRAKRAGVELAPADQEAFVREETKGKFGLSDAQKVIASIDTGISGRNLGRSFAQGVLFNFGDEALGLLPESLGGGDAAREEMRLRDDMFSRQHPIANAAAGIAGGLAVPGLGAGAASAKAGATLGQVALRGAALGAGAGALAGAGSGEGAEDRLGRAAMGAAVGGVAGAAVPAAVGAARALYSPAARAARRFQGAIDRSGGVDAVRSANAAVQAAGRGEQAITGDLSQPLRQATDFAANNDEGTMSKVVDVLGQRQQDASERILGDVRAQVGDPLSARRVAELEESRRAWADPAYDALRQSTPQIPTSSNLAQVLSRPLVKKAFERAKENGLVQDFPDVGNPSVTHLLDLRRALKSQEGVAFAKGDGTLGTGLKEARKQIEAELEKSVPGWKAVNDEYARRKGLEQAVADGVTWFNQKDSRGLADYFKSLSPEAQNEFRLGMASELIAKLSSAQTNRTVANELVNASPAMQRKLEVVFGDKAGFEKFMQGPRVEKELSRLNKVAGGSQTHARGQAAEADPAELGMAVAHNPTGAAGLLAGAAARMGKGAMARRTAAALGPYLTTQGYSNIDRLLSAFATDRPQLVGPTIGAALPTSLGGLLGDNR